MFVHGGICYRQVNRVHAQAFEQLAASGLLAELVGDGLMIDHAEVSAPVAEPRTAWRILQPRQLPFVSYPYEWCFGQLQDAALLTLDIQIRALRHGMTLKDASAFNIQFVQGRPMLIDTLSLVPWVDGTPWVGYRQFCRHFLAPLALMARRDIRLGQLLRVHLDGVPLDLASALLPRRSWLSPGILAHLHLHARSERRFSATDSEVPALARRLAHVSHRGLLALLQGLRSTVAGLRWHAVGTEWADYYASTHYSDAAMSAKRRIVSAFLDAAKPATVWDFGANTGEFSQLAARRGAMTVAFDNDAAAVERHYRSLTGASGNRPLPLLLDLANPSAGIGWAHEERESLRQRGPADCVMALALMHHVCIGNNVPFALLADFLAHTCRAHLIIEFVPRTDEQVRRLLRGREDTFSDYAVAPFEAAFCRHYDIIGREPVEDCSRVLYLMRRHVATGQCDAASTMEARR